jgi:hypothetical protein
MKLTIGWLVNIRSSGYAEWQGPVKALLPRLCVIVLKSGVVLVAASFAPATMMGEGMK